MFDERPNEANDYEYLTPVIVATSGYLNASEARPPTATAVKRLPNTPTAGKVTTTAQTAATPLTESTYSKTAPVPRPSATGRPPPQVARQGSAVSTHKNNGGTNQAPEQELKNFLTSIKLRPTGSSANVGGDQTNLPRTGTLTRPPPSNQPRVLGGRQDMASKPGEQNNPQNQPNVQVKTSNRNGEVKTDRTLTGRQHSSDKSEISRQARPAVPVNTPPGHPVGTVAPVPRASAIQPGVVKSPDPCKIPDYQHAQIETAKTWKASEWKTINDVPVGINIAQMTVDDVAKCLKLLKFTEDTVQKFVDNDIDGSLLLSLDEKILVGEFGFQLFDSRKLLKFANEDWRPKTENTESWRSNEQTHFIDARQIKHLFITMLYSVGIEQITRISIIFQRWTARKDIEVLNVLRDTSYIMSSK